MDTHGRGYSIQLTPKGQVHIKQQAYYCNGRRRHPYAVAAMVPFIDSQQVDSGSKYHSFEFVSVNYIPEGRVTETFKDRVNGGTISYE